MACTMHRHFFYILFKIGVNEMSKMPKMHIYINSMIAILVLLLHLPIVHAEDVQKIKIQDCTGTQYAYYHDIAVDGKGYLVVKPKYRSQQFYVRHYPLAYETTMPVNYIYPVTHLLSYNRDLHLQGWKLDKTGTSTGDMTELSFDYFYINEKTKQITLVNYLENIHSDGIYSELYDGLPSACSYFNTVDICVSYMSDSSIHWPTLEKYILEVKICFDKYTNQNNERDFFITCNPESDKVTPIDGLIDSGKITFGTDNKIMDITLENGECNTSESCIFMLKAIDPEADQEIILDMTSKTKLWDEPSVNVYMSSNYPGRFYKMQIQHDGTIYGQYKNIEESIPVFQLAIADFSYTAGLNEYYDQIFMETYASGHANITLPEKADMGFITSTTDCYDIMREPCDLIVQFDHTPETFTHGKCYPINAHVRNKGKGYGSSYFYYSEMIRNNNLDAHIEWSICTSQDCSIESNWDYQQSGSIFYYTPDYGQSLIRASFNGDAPCDECDDTNNFSQFTVQLENPTDLIVRDIWWDSEVYAYGQAVTFFAKIENISNGISAQNIDVHFWADKGTPFERDLGTVMIWDDILSTQHPLFSNHSFENGFTGWSILSGNASVETYFRQIGYCDSDNYKTENMRINGDGFLVFRDTKCNELLFTKVSQIKRSHDGFLYNRDGYRLQGWKQNPDTNEYIQESVPIKIEKNKLTLETFPTNRITVRFHLNNTISGSTINLSECWNGMETLEYKRISSDSYFVHVSTDIIDKTERVHQINVYFQKNTDSEWEYIVTCNPDEIFNRAYTAQDGLLATGFIFVDTEADQNNIIGMTCNNQTVKENDSHYCSFDVDFAGLGDSIMKIDLDFGIKGMNSDIPSESSITFNTSSRIFGTSNGYKKGGLYGYKFSDTGILLGLYSNGKTLPIGYQLELANCINIDTFEKVGGQYFRQTSLSEQIQFSPPETDGLGSLDVYQYYDSHPCETIEEEFNHKVGNAHYASLKGLDTLLRSPSFIAKEDTISFKALNLGPAAKKMYLRKVSDNQILSEVHCNRKSTIDISTFFDEAHYIVKDIDNNSEYLTRTGSFHINKKGFLADADGMIVQGWQLNPYTGERYEPITNINLNTINHSKPVQTSKIELVVNLNSTIEPGNLSEIKLSFQWNPDNPNGKYLSDEAYDFSTTTIFYDNGQSHDLVIYFKKRRYNNWEFIVTCQPDADKRSEVNNKEITYSDLIHNREELSYIPYCYTIKTLEGIGEPLFNFSPLIDCRAASWHPYTPLLSRGLLAEGSLIFSFDGQLKAMTLNGKDRPEINQPYFQFFADFNGKPDTLMHIPLDFGIQYMWNDNLFDIKRNQIPSTSFASTSVVVQQNTDGFPGGKVLKTEVTENGIFRGFYSDGQILQFYQLILAQYTNSAEKRTKPKGKQRISNDIIVGPPLEMTFPRLYYFGDLIWEKPAWHVYQMDISSFKGIDVFLEFQMEETHFFTMESPEGNNFMIDEIGISGDNSTMTAVAFSDARWAPIKGKHTITAHVDYQNAIQEVDENNNSLNVQFGRYGSIFGTVTTTITGYTAHISGATISLMDTDYIAQSDESGNYTFTNVPVGNYTLVVTSPYFQSTKTFVDVLSGSDVTASMDMTALQQIDIETIIKKYDPSGDGKVGLEEAIHALKKLVEHQED